MYKVIIVDDEPLTREYINTFIKNLSGGWIVTGEAMDGGEALEILDREKADLVITDIMMPVLDGLELCRAISSKYPGTNMIILTGYDEFKYAKEALQYGVMQYLVKPIVSEELKSALDSAAKRIDQERNRDVAYQTLLTLSEGYKEQVVKNLIKAIIFDANIEIKSLYPIVHKLRINIIEAESAIMLLDIDEEILLKNKLPPSEAFLLRSILNKYTEEVLSDLNAVNIKDTGNRCGYVTLDCNGNTAVYMTGPSKDVISAKCFTVYDKVQTFMSAHSGLTVTGALGSCRTDVLQMNLSYQEAAAMQLNRLAKGGGSMYVYGNEDMEKYGAKLESAVSSVLSAVMDGGGVRLRMALADYTGLMTDYSLMSIYRNLIYLLKCVSKLRGDSSSELLELSFKLLQNRLDAYVPGDGKDVVGLFEDTCLVLSRGRPLAMGSGEGSSEAAIVSKAKDFVMQHYSEPISLAMIADNAGITPSYLSNIFHKCAGESYIKFLTRVRMEQAARLLKEKQQIKVYEIAEKVGYINVKHFSYVFKQYYNVTPGEYQASEGSIGLVE